VSALAVIQARMGSTRLPGKVLADVEGEPLIGLLLARLARATRVDRVVVAISEQAADDVLEDALAGLGARVVRGPEQDVLTRFLAAAEGHDGPVVRLTADCPLTDPLVVDAVIERFAQTDGCAYASNVDPRTYPDGLDVEVVSAEALRTAAREAQDPLDREHVTSFVRRDPGRFPQAALVHDPDLGDLRWTVDRPDDLEFVRETVRRLGERRHTASLDEILRVADERREPPAP
jgi:spore coat polysaccharide biosynthesis protein SpsF (cytidylyltransferase family)